MDRSTAKHLIVDLVQQDRIALTEHAKRRDPMAGKYPLTLEQIRNCLIRGTILEGPTPDIKIADGWKVTVTRHKADERHSVVAILVPHQRVLIITGYAWTKG